MKVPAVLKNKYLFYALAVLAALNVIGYASVKAYECLALFLLAGYGMHCYCNNKSLSILAALFVANFVFGCGRVKEGFEEAMKAPEDLLKDAAQAAADAGGMLAKEGKEKEAMVQACNQVALDAADAKEQCEDKSKYSDDGGKTACKFTAEIRGKCMKNGQEVQGRNADTCNADDNEEWMPDELVSKAKCE